MKIDENRQFLEQQLYWFKEQDRILAKMEMKLYEMREITQYALDFVLTNKEIEKLNAQLSHLKSEVLFLEKQLQFFCSLR
jgi:polyhydroxyalkanoate synthesis regulator phasin